MYRLCPRPLYRLALRARHGAPYLKILASPLTRNTGGIPFSRLAAKFTVLNSINEPVLASLDAAKVRQNTISSSAVRESSSSLVSGSRNRR
jgi:hypothetical protein